MHPVMSSLRLAALLLAVSPLLSLHPILGQQAAPLPVAPSQRVKQGVETSISVGAQAQLTAARITETKTMLATQSLFPSAGVLVTFRQSFRPWLGYSVNLGYTRASYRYVAAAPAGYAGTTGETFIPNNIYETSVSYLAQKRLTDRVSVFGEAGGGAMGFAAMMTGVHSTPTSFSLIFRKNTFRPEAITGFGMDYRLSHGLGLRAEYRGLFVKFPDYASGLLKATTIVSEPTCSLTYRFGRQSGLQPR